MQQRRAPSTPAVVAAAQLLSLALLLLFLSAATAASVTTAAAKQAPATASGARCKLHIKGDLGSGNITAATLSCTDPGITAAVHPLLWQHVGNATGVSQHPTNCGAGSSQDFPCLVAVCDTAYAAFDAPVVSGFKARDNLQYAFCVSLGSYVHIQQGKFSGNAGGTIAADNGTVVIVNSTFQDNAVVGPGPYRPGITALGHAAVLWILRCL